MCFCLILSSSLSPPSFIGSNASGLAHESACRLARYPLAGGYGHALHPIPVASSGAALHPCPPSIPMVEAHHFRRHEDPTCGVFVKARSTSHISIRSG
jgi:hypothetical protein